MNESRTTAEIIGEMKSLGMDADKIFERIREELERGNIKVAREQLDFVDALIASALPAPLPE